MKTNEILSFDIQNDDEELRNYVYDSVTQYKSKTQSNKIINQLTKNAPIVVYCDLQQFNKKEKNNQMVSFIVPANTTYLFVENGWLYATSGKVEISQELKSLQENSRPDTEKQLHCEQSMTNAYVFTDIDDIQKVAKLNGKLGYTPTVYTINLEHEIFIVEKLKVNKEQRKKWKSFYKNN